MDRRIEPIEECKFPQMAVVPESSVLTIALVSGQKIIINGDGSLPATSMFNKIFDAAEELRLNPQKDSVTIDLPRDQQ